MWIAGSEQVQKVFLYKGEEVAETEEAEEEGSEHKKAKSDFIKKMEVTHYTIHSLSTHYSPRL